MSGRIAVIARGCQTLLGSCPEEFWVCFVCAILWWGILVWVVDICFVGFGWVVLLCWWFVFPSAICTFRMRWVQLRVDWFSFLVLLFCCGVDFFISVDFVLWFLPCLYFSVVLSHSSLFFPFLWSLLSFVLLFYSVPACNTSRTFPVLLL